MVSVIVPAFNAERWIEKTIASVQNQTHSNLEIIIVVDGATDRTEAIAQALAAADQRIVVRSVPNGGVAQARNTGLAIARGEFVAPLDADDLWHPERLARHVAALKGRSDQYAVAYSPYVSIDTEDRTFNLSRLHRSDGFVFGSHLCANFVGNGSALLIRTQALRSVGGYEPGLRARGGEGCEDYLVQLRLAYRYKFICVEQPLIGYRTMPGNMSSNLLKMRKSRLFMLDDVERFAAQFPRAMFFHPRAEAVLNLAVRHLREGDAKSAVFVWTRELTRNPLLALYTPFAALGRLRDEIGKIGKRLFPKHRPAGVPFAAWNPDGPVGAPYPLLTRALMRIYDRYENKLRNQASSAEPATWAIRTRGDDA